MVLILGGAVLLALPLGAFFYLRASAPEVSGLRWLETFHFWTDKAWMELDAVPQRLKPSNCVLG